MKLCVCVFLVSAAVLAAAQKDDQDYDTFYDDYIDDDTLIQEGKKIEEELDKLKDVNDLNVREDIEKFIKENQDYDAKDLEDIEDYQFEDNRDKPKDVQSRDMPADNGSFKVRDNEPKVDGKVSDDYALLWGDDGVAPLPVPDTETVLEDNDSNNSDDTIIEDEETKKIHQEIDDLFPELDGNEDLLSQDDDTLGNKEEQINARPDNKIIDETRKILEETDDSFNGDVPVGLDELKSQDNVVPNSKEVQINPKLDDIIDETKKILEETDESFNSNAAIDEIDDEAISKDIFDDTKKILDGTDDTFNNNDIVKEIDIESTLNPRFDDLSANNEDHEETNLEKVRNEEVLPIEDIDDDSVDKAYADLHSDLDKLLDTLDKLTDSSDNDEKISEILDKIDEHIMSDDTGDMEEFNEDIVKNNPEYADIDLDKVLQNIFDENDMVDTKELNLQNDEINMPNPDDVFEKDAEKLPKSNVEPILLDAIIDNDNNEAESIESDDDKNIDASIEKTLDINLLNSQEMEDLVKQFAIANSDILDVNSENFDQNVAPIHITLDVDTPVVVTSPNYPSAYPTNNIVDWVFDGEGMGIEINITDFAVNGALGDYLMVKPGGLDDSGHDSLLFTYRLNSEKNFRFTDVDRVFVRFESKPGFMFMRGFRFTIKMIGPLPEEPAPIPEPEPVIQPPLFTHAVHLATAPPQFQELKEQFRLLLADMAEQYIADNDIEPGQNATSEITQITSISTCPVTWPNYERCTLVTFGVPLTSESDEDQLGTEELRDMWNTLSTRDPFALRLKQMGFTEFQPPASSIITAWLVIASGVVISMAMLAFVLWRFSCFEDYTRMKTYSDTDSLHNEKRGLDLYPTPHQTLPPLYAENEYKWGDNEDTTRVDMGGFANKSYARDMYDFESDEDVVPPSTRTGAVSARDVYNGSNA